MALYNIKSTNKIVPITALKTFKTPFKMSIVSNNSNNSNNSKKSLQLNPNKTKSGSWAHDEDEDSCVSEDDYSLESNNNDFKEFKTKAKKPIDHFVITNNEESIDVVIDGKYAKLLDDKKLDVMSKELIKTILLRDDTRGQSGTVKDETGYYSVPVVIMCDDMKFLKFKIISTFCRQCLRCNIDEKFTNGCSWHGTNCAGNVVKNHHTHTDGIPNTIFVLNSGEDVHVREFYKSDSGGVLLPTFHFHDNDVQHRPIIVTDVEAFGSELEPSIFFDSLLFKNMNAVKKPFDKPVKENVEQYVPKDNAYARKVTPTVSSPKVEQKTAPIVMSSAVLMSQIPQTAKDVKSDTVKTSIKPSRVTKDKHVVETEKSEIVTKPSAKTVPTEQQLPASDEITKLENELRLMDMQILLEKKKAELERLKLARSSESFSPSQEQTNHHYPQYPQECYGTASGEYSY
jgi:hypothetical protein